MAKFIKVNMMKNLLLSLSLVLGFATLIQAQTAVPTSKLAWDQSNATLAEAQAYTYKMYADGAAVGTSLTGVTCVAGTPVVCSVNFPAFTPGNHTIQLSATNLAGESVKSDPFAFTFVVVPTTPGNLRIQ